MLRRWAGWAVTGPMAFLLSGVLDLGALALYLWRRRRARRHHDAASHLVGVAAGVTVFILCAVAAVGARPAGASTTEPSILMDDHAFIYSSPAQVEKNLQQVAALGVNTVKVSVVWSLVAPDPNSYTKPNFDATDPDAYPAVNWERYDTLVQEVRALGMSVYFQLTAPAPLWATVRQGVTGRQHPWSHEPNPREFGQFVQAVGERYSGNWPIPGAAPSSGSAAGSTLGGGLLGTFTQPSPAPAAAGSQSMLPAVRMWGIWNEPNEVGWLSPQVQKVHGRSEMTSPALERGLTDAGYTALAQTGHAMDTILIGETASGGDTHVIPFLDALFCVNGADEPLRGPAAVRVGCPPSGDPRRFVIDNPGLFAASGWAHHPYSFNQPPNVPFPNAPSTITLANLGVLESALDRIDATYGEPTGLPIYITEWGYKSNPPNPYVRTSLVQQEDWLDEGWYMSYFMGRVKSMAQELLYDQPPVAGTQPGSTAYWSNFDSGLEFVNGKAKPSLAAFRLPIWVPVADAGARRTVWAEIRPATVGDNSQALLEFRAPGQRSWEGLVQLTAGPEGFVLAHVNLPGPGLLRIAWGDIQRGVVLYSRTVPIG